MGEVLDVIAELKAEGARRAATAWISTCDRLSLPNSDIPHAISACAPIRRRRRCSPRGFGSVHAGIPADRAVPAVTAEQIAKVLATAPLFADLDLELLLAVARYGDEARFVEGTFLARDGWPADRFFVLLDGAVALEAHGDDQTARRCRLRRSSVGAG